MRLFVAKEPTQDKRVAAVPETVRRLIQLGLEVDVESQAGAGSRIPDQQFTDAGATISHRDKVSEADIVLRVQPPAKDEIAKLKKGSLHVSFLNPFADKELVQAFANAGVTAISLELIPRTTLAQKMDTLSSQASLAGYAAVLLSATTTPQILPMMMTPAGTIQPAKYFIIGVGVAGLQAIATAKRLGARVEAFDTRPTVEEQVTSLGAKFVKIDIGKTGQTEQGYAEELSPEQLDLQRQEMAKVCAKSDVVITTAKLFGRPAPVLVTEEMINAMAPGSVIIDLASSSSGGNVVGSKYGESILTKNGVTIIGPAIIENTVARDASLMFASNLANFLEHFWDKEAAKPVIDPEDEILSACLLTQNGSVVHPDFTNSKSDQ